MKLSGCHKRDKFGIYCLIISHQWSRKLGMGTNMGNIERDIKFYYLLLIVILKYLIYYY